MEAPFKVSIIALCSNFLDASGVLSAFSANSFHVLTYLCEC